MGFHCQQFSLRYISTVAVLPATLLMPPHFCGLAPQEIGLPYASALYSGTGKVKNWDMESSAPFLADMATLLYNKEKTISIKTNGVMKMLPRLQEEMAEMEERLGYSITPYEWNSMMQVSGKIAKLLAGPCSFQMTNRKILLILEMTKAALLAGYEGYPMDE